MRSKILLMLPFLVGVALSAALLARAEVSNPVQIFVRPSVVCTVQPTQPISNDTITWTAIVAPNLSNAYNFQWTFDGAVDTVQIEAQATKRYTSAGGPHTARIKVTPKISAPADISNTKDCPSVTVGEPPKPDLTASAPVPSLESTGVANEYYESSNATVSGSVNNIGTADAPPSFTSKYYFKFSSLSSWSEIGGAKGLTSTATPVAAFAQNRAVSPSDPLAFNGSVEGKHIDLRLCANRPISAAFIESNATDASNCTTKTIVVKKRPIATLDLTVDATPVAGDDSQSDTISVPYNTAHTLRWKGANLIAGSCRSTGPNVFTAGGATENANGISTGALTAARYEYTITCDKTAESLGANSLSDTVVVNVGEPGTGGDTTFSQMQCAVSPSSPHFLNQTEVVWSISGAPSGTSYQWSGTNSLSGTNFSVKKIYDTLGAKTASVLLTLPGNRTGTINCPTITVMAPDLTAGASVPSLELIAGTTNEYYESSNATVSGSVNNIGTADAPPSFTSKYYFKFSSLSSWSEIGGAKGLTSTATPVAAFAQNRAVSPSDPLAFNGSVEGKHIDIKLCADAPASSITESNEANNCAERTIVVKKLPSPVLNTPTPVVAACTPRVGGNGLLVSWSSVSATSHKLIAINSQTLETRTISGITGTSYTDSGLTPGIEYRYAVAGVVGSKEGPLSATKTAVVPAACFDYDLSANNTTVERGRSVTTSSTRTLLFGTTRSVTLSLTSIVAPDGPSVTGSGRDLTIGSGSRAFDVRISNPVSANPTATSNIVVDTGNSTPLGSYTVGVRGIGTETLADGSNREVIRDTQFSVSVSDRGDPNVACSLNAAPDSVFSGGSATLSWSSQNASVCTGTNFSTGNTTNGSVGTGALTANQNYSLSCRNASGSKTCSASASVTVAPPGGGGNNPPQPPPPPPDQGPGTGEETTLQAVCFATLQDPDDLNGDNIPNPDETVTWTAIVSCSQDSGSCTNPAYNYLWSGTSPLAGKQSNNDTSSSDVQRVSYRTTGLKTGGVTVTEIRSGETETITCEGVDGGITIANEAPRDFSVNATPSTIYIERFRDDELPPSSQAAITVSPQGGFDSTVSLTASPTSLSVRVGNDTIRTNVTFIGWDGNRTTLSSGNFITGKPFSVSLSNPDFPNGNYEFTITGTSGGRRRDATVLLQVVTVKPTFEEF